MQAANWTVPAHQDVIVPAAAVPEIAEVFARYGAIYAAAPDDVLQTMVAVRLHLDPCPT